jgi:hypothetical protein
VLVRVEHAHPVGGFVPPANADVSGREHFAQLVADEIDDRLKVELGADSLLDAVDHLELAHPLVERRRALGDLLLEPLRPARVGERDRALRREHRKQVAIGVTEAPVGTAEVDV